MVVENQFPGFVGGSKIITYLWCIYNFMSRPGLYP